MHITTYGTRQSNDCSQSTHLQTRFNSKYEHRPRQRPEVNRFTSPWSSIWSGGDVVEITREGDQVGGIVGPRADGGDLQRAVPIGVEDDYPHEKGAIRFLLAIYRKRIPHVQSTRAAHALLDPKTQQDRTELA